MKIASYVFGILAMISLFSAYQQKSRGRLIIAKLSADVFWASHYFCLAAYGGMIPNFVGISRELVFLQRDKKAWASSPLVPVIFILINFGLGFYTFKSPINILPIAASSVVTVSLWLRRPSLTKLLSVPISISFLIYDFFVGSYIGMVNESLAILSIAAYFIKNGGKDKVKSIFSSDFATDKKEIITEGGEIEDYAAKIAEEVSVTALEKGEAFATEIEERFISDFEKPGESGDKMAHVSTFMLIDDIIYMTYYANTKSAEEDPSYQTARLVYCPKSNPQNKVFLDVQSVGDECCGLRVNLVYDTILARKDKDTLLVLWTAKIGDNYYRLYRAFSISKKVLGEIGVNRLKVGSIVNDFSATGIVSALSENGLGHKTMYSDIGIMQKFTSRSENGDTYYYTGAYSGDLNFIIKSRDFITWEYVAAPDFINKSKWENACYVLSDKLYYLVRQWEDISYAFLTVYDLNTGKWEKPSLVYDSQSRSDFIFYKGGLYLFHAPCDREHIGIIKINTDDVSKSEVVLRAKMKSSCFYPFVQYFGDELAMSYTVARKHIRLAEFTLSKYLD